MKREVIMPSLFFAETLISHFYFFQIVTFYWGGVVHKRTFI